MHASTEQILSLRDGGPVDARVHEHVAACSACKSQLQELREMRAALRALPPLRPPDDAWAAIAAAAGAVPHSAGGGAYRWLGMAAAAAIVAVVAVLARMPGPALAPQAATPQLAAQPKALPATTVAPVDETPALVARSAELENALFAMRYRPRIVNAGTASTIALLEDRLAMVDYRLSGGAAEPLPAGEAQRLWRQRVELMDSLVNVRYAQIQRRDF